MVEAMRKDFDCIYSIELSNDFYKRVVTRFDGIKNINLIHGDSGIALKDVMEKINQPALFCLDGHYSGGPTAMGDKETPIIEELNCILKAPYIGHVIVIDDASVFGPNPAYPSIEELTQFVKSELPQSEINIENDSIRITPKIN
jgi:hypothetical protein